MKITKKEDAEHEHGMKIGTCHWCIKTGIVSYTPSKPDFPDQKLNNYIEELNSHIVANRLIKIVEGIFACKECISAYDLVPLSE